MEEKPDPLKQLIQALSRKAQADQSTEAIADDNLYIHYSDIMAKSCSGEDDDDDEGGGEEETLSFQVCPDWLSMIGHRRPVL